MILQYRVNDRLGADSYEGQRIALMRILCPARKCHWCAKRPAWRNLTFDHVNTRNWLPHRVNRWQRLRTYWREWVAAGAAVGTGIVGACASCNSSRGAKRNNARVYSPAQVRRRNSRGVGYTSGYTEHCRRELERAAG